MDKTKNVPCTCCSSDYLDFQNLKHGYLLIFDFNKNKQYKTESINFKDKEIFALWV